MPPVLLLPFLVSLGWGKNRNLNEEPDLEATGSTSRAADADAGDALGEDVGAEEDDDLANDEEVDGEDGADPIIDDIIAGNPSLRTHIRPQRTGTMLSTTTSQLSSSSSHPKKHKLSNWFGIKHRQSMIEEQNVIESEAPPQTETPGEPRRGVRMGRTFTSFSTLSISDSETDKHKDHEGFFTHWHWFRRAKDFVLQTGPYADHGEYIPNYRWYGKPHAPLPTFILILTIHYRTPIFSGVLVPFSILLEIPGTTGHWYIRTEGTQTVEVRPNPALLEIGIGISMGMGVIANIALIRRFSEHQPKEMTIIAIICLTIHGVFFCVCYF